MSAAQRWQAASAAPRVRIAAAVLAVHALAIAAALQATTAVFRPREAVPRPQAETIEVVWLSAAPSPARPVARVAPAPRPARAAPPSAPTAPATPRSAEPTPAAPPMAEPLGADIGARASPQPGAGSPGPGAATPTPSPTPIAGATGQTSAPAAVGLGSAAAGPTTAPPAAQSTAGAMPAAISDTQVGYLRRPRPHFPPLSRRLGESGRVTLRVHIDVAGQPTEVAVVAGSGYPRLDDAARQAAWRALFRPYVEAGAARAVWVNLSIVFTLDDA